MSLLGAIAPRIIIPGFFIGPKLLSMTDPVEISQTIAFSLLFVSAVLVVFSENGWLALIPGIAAWSYWNMLRDKESIEFYRYTDWALTTPLMLLALVSANSLPLLQTAGVLLLDLLMIACGYYGVKETDETKKMVLFTLGCLFFLPILYVIITMKKAKYAVWLTVVLWTLYPLIWYSDEEALVTKTTANVAYSVMDVMAKVGLVNLLGI
jgi:bacteriorhodopsin